MSVYIRTTMVLVSHSQASRKSSSWELGRSQGLSIRVLHTHLTVSLSSVPTVHHPPAWFHSTTMCYGDKTMGYCCFSRFNSRTPYRICRCRGVSMPQLERMHSGSRVTIPLLHCLSTSGEGHTACIRGESSSPPQ